MISERKTMDTLTKHLNNEHRDLLIKLNRVKMLGRISPEAKDLLFNSKQILLSHLKKEDERLYPILEKAGENNEKINKLAKTFASKMETISTGAIDFLKKYEKENEGIKFAADLGGLLVTLRHRVFKEESALYEMFNEIKNPAF
jgi:DUF438 domain-containing protein